MDARTQQISKDWLTRGARFGLMVEGVVYALIGVLAIQAAVGSGGRVGGHEAAVQYLGSQPFGQILLALVGIGLLAYSAWRFIMALADTENEGTDASGIVKRLGFAASGLLNVGIAITALQMALGSSREGGDAKTWAAKIMNEPFGQWLVGLLGLVVIGVGIAQLYSAYTKRFLEGLETAGMSQQVRRAVVRMGQAGYASRGVVFPIIGVALVSAALNHDPSEAKGMGEALRTVAGSTHGRLLLILVAAGLLAYGVFMVALAKYRRVRIDTNLSLGVRVLR
jgi:hypothetical protein